MNDLKTLALNAFNALGQHDGNKPHLDAIQVYIKDLKDGRVAALGTDEAFTLRDDTGLIKATVRKVHLSAQDGTLVQPVPNSPFVVSAQGYEVLAEAMGACVMCPPNVLVNGEQKLNPYVVSDPVTGRPLRVYARAVAFRFSSQGLPQVSDHTTMFDLPAYRLIDLLGKAKKYPQAFRLLPNEMTMPSNANDSWARYPFDAATSLWVNTSHDEGLQWYAQILNREKKALDFAQTFAKRNAMKHLSGYQRAPGPDWVIKVLCWRPENSGMTQWSMARYVETQKNISGLSDGSSRALGPAQEQHTIDIRQTSSEIGEEAEDLAATMDEEDRAELAAPQDATPQQPEQSHAIMQALQARSELPDEFAQVCAQLGVSPNTELTTDLATKIMRGLNSMLDEEAA